jgi:hypothetical protein
MRRGLRRTMPDLTLAGASARPLRDRSCPIEPAGDRAHPSLPLPAAKGDPFRNAVVQMMHDSIGVPEYAAIARTDLV